LTITSKAKVKNSSAAIHHIISYQRILCCAVVFAGRVFDLLYDTMMMGVRCGGTTLFEIRVTFYGFPSEFNWRDRSRSLRQKDFRRKGHKQVKRCVECLSRSTPATTATGSQGVIVLFPL
jgi:hypothetical protein